jgi:HPt (histidine-containing phosphotransfer) domain-containing protein
MALTIADIFFYTAIQKPTDEPYHRIMRAAHVIKGAAANLMCGQLREASMQLEQSASRAHEAGAAGVTPDMTLAVQSHYTAMQQAGQNFFAFLQSIGV